MHPSSCLSSGSILLEGASILPTYLTAVTLHVEPLKEVASLTLGFEQYLPIIIGRRGGCRHLLPLVAAAWCSLSRRVGFGERGLLMARGNLICPKVSVDIKPMLSPIEWCSRGMR